MIYYVRKVVANAACTCWQVEQAPAEKDIAEHKGSTQMSGNILSWAIEEHSDDREEGSGALLRECVWRVDD